ncbi:phage tail tape measure protein [Pseudomonas aestusnigri]|uniref:phage tail tape measure protein n=1 Tax=Halopseudomonas aestusnigri TaxID=857252 RepID=UPI001D18CFDD|nr:phage tail tape measure protein [Halopseudomonas aestusnigri]MCC4261088.1 phage tail tape measure protein [Halopseudomonas aestusnigri]
MTDVELKLTANTRDAELGIAGFSKKYSALVRELSKPLGRVNAFRDLESSLEQSGRQAQQARDRVRDLANEMARTESPTQQLTASYAESVRELQRLERQEKAQTVQLARMREELKGAGIDTRNLAGEQSRLQRELATQMGRSDRAGAIEMARQNLGLAAYGEAQARVGELQRDLQLLQSTGKLTAGELAIVGGTMTSALAAAGRKVQEAESATESWTESLRNVRSELLAGGIAFGALGLAGKRSFDEYSSFTQRMAEIGTITNQSGAEMSQLAAAVRQVSRDMGQAASGGAGALYDIISSGVEAGNSVAVLEQAGRAAVAGLTDTQTAAKLGLSVINAYGEGVDQLESRYDQLFLAVREGVTTFPELAGAIGQALPTAAAAEVSFGEVTAALALMTKQGINTNIATTSLRSAINNLAAPAPEAKKNLEAMGITWNGLSDTLRQISEQNLGIEAMRQIIPDTEARTAVLALTGDIDGLLQLVEEMESAGGTTQAAYDKMKDTPEQQIKRFTSAVNDLQISFGQAVAAGLPVVNLITDMLNAFNELPEDVRTTIAAVVILGAGAKALSVVMKGLQAPMSALLGSLRTTPGAATAAGAGMASAATKVTLLGSALNLAWAAGVKLTGIGLALWIADLASEYAKLYSEIQRVNQAKEDQEKLLRRFVAENKSSADALILSGEEVDRLTEIERNAYVERLKAARAYYKAEAELASLADVDRDGITGRVSDEAIAAARQTRIYAEAVTAVQTEQQRREDAERDHAATIKRIQQGELASIKEELSKQLKAYDDAANDLEAKLNDIAKKREASQKRFEQLAASFSVSGRPGTATFGDVTDAKYQARDALRRGDTEQALAQADRAAKVLEELRDAGANTYGFEGIARELGQIADEALKLDAANAQAAFEEQKAKVDQLVQSAKALEAIQVSYASDDESEEQTKARILALAAEWAKYMQVPVTYVLPEKVDAERVAGVLGAETSAPGFAGGGKITGPGTGTSDSILMWGSDGEFMMRKRAVDYYGTDFMHRLNQMRLPRYAIGGEVAYTPSALPAIPELKPAVSAPGPFGTLNLMLADQQYTLQGDSGTIEALLKAGKRYGLKKG